MADSIFGSAMILAGGLSSRMGFDKKLITIKGVSVIEHSIDLLSGHFNEIIIADNTSGCELYRDCRIIHVQDIIPNGGPVSGIHSGLENASSKFVYVTACDMPNINMEYILYMENLIERERYDVSACVTRFGDWIEPFNSFYSKGMLNILQESILSQQRQIHRILQKTDCIYIDEDIARMYSHDWSMFENLNTKEDLILFFKNKVL